ncbi:hypothetical protein HDU96_006668 [Phlyctochytrium bullatum]|nr:hypothetical protein HDU96_006668 [Phlyctochytrium bullatum]
MVDDGVALPHLHRRRRSSGGSSISSTDDPDMDTDIPLPTAAAAAAAAAASSSSSSSSESPSGGAPLERKSSLRIVTHEEEEEEEVDDDTDSDDSEYDEEEEEEEEDEPESGASDDSGETLAVPSGGGGGVFHARRKAYMDPIQLAFLTTCKLNHERVAPTNNLCRLVLMQNMLHSIYGSWAQLMPSVAPPPPPSAQEGYTEEEEEEDAGSDVTEEDEENDQGTEDYVEAPEENTEEMPTRRDRGMRIDLSGATVVEPADPVPTTTHDQAHPQAQGVDARRVVDKFLSAVDGSISPPSSTTANPFFVEATAPAAPLSPPSPGVSMARSLSADAVSPRRDMHRRMASAPAVTAADDEDDVPLGQVMIRRSLSDAEPRPNPVAPAAEPVVVAAPTPAPVPAPVMRSSIHPEPAPTPTPTTPVKPPKSALGGKFRRMASLSTLFGSMKKKPPVPSARAASPGPERSAPVQEETPLGGGRRRRSYSATEADHRRWAEEATNAAATAAPVPLSKWSKQPAPPSSTLAAPMTRSMSTPPGPPKPVMVTVAVQTDPVDDEDFAWETETVGGSGDEAVVAPTAAAERASTHSGSTLAGPPSPEVVEEGVRLTGPGSVFPSSAPAAAAVAPAVKPQGVGVTERVTRGGERRLTQEPASKAEVREFFSEDEIREFTGLLDRVFFGESPSPAPAPTPAAPARKERVEDGARVSSTRGVKPAPVAVPRAVSPPAASPVEEVPTPRRRGRDTVLSLDEVFRIGWRLEGVEAGEREAGRLSLQI